MSPKRSACETAVTEIFHAGQRMADGRASLQRRQVRAALADLCVARADLSEAIRTLEHWIASELGCDEESAA